MDYAIQLFLPVIGGLLLGVWIEKNHWQTGGLLTVGLAVGGLFMGIGIMVKRLMFKVPPTDSEHDVKDRK